MTTSLLRRRIMDNETDEESGLSKTLTVSSLSTLSAQQPVPMITANGEVDPALEFANLQQPGPVLLPPPEAIAEKESGEEADAGEDGGVDDADAEDVDADAETGEDAGEDANDASVLTAPDQDQDGLEQVATPSEQTNDTVIMMPVEPNGGPGDGATPLLNTTENADVDEIEESNNVDTEDAIENGTGGNETTAQQDLNTTNVDDKTLGDNDPDADLIIDPREDDEVDIDGNQTNVTGTVADEVENAADPSKNTTESETIMDGSEVEDEDETTSPEPEKSDKVVTEPEKSDEVDADAEKPDEVDADAEKPDEVDENSDNDPNELDSEVSAASSENESANDDGEDLEEQQTKSTDEDPDETQDGDADNEDSQSESEFRSEDEDEDDLETGAPKSDDSDGDANDPGDNSLVDSTDVFEEEEEEEEGDDKDDRDINDHENGDDDPMQEEGRPTVTDEDDPETNDQDEYTPPEDSATPVPNPPILPSNTQKQKNHHKNLPHKRCPKDGSSSSLTCQLSSHPLLAISVSAFVPVVVLLLWFRRKRARDLDSRGEYRAVAAQYSDMRFDNAFTDDYSSDGDMSYNDDDDNGLPDVEDSWGKSGTRIIEMGNLKEDERNGGLSLEEMNG